MMFPILLFPPEWAPEDQCEEIILLKKINTALRRTGREKKALPIIQTSTILMRPMYRDLRISQWMHQCTFFSLCYAKANRDSRVSSTCFRLVILSQCRDNTKKPWQWRHHAIDVKHIHLSVTATQDFQLRRLQVRVMVPRQQVVFWEQWSQGDEGMKKGMKINSLLAANSNFFSMSIDNLNPH